jgi:hypothetical protein
MGQSMVINRFTNGLPNNIYKFIFTHKQPQTYEQWCKVAIDQQKVWVNVKKDDSTNTEQQQHPPNNSTVIGGELSPAPRHPDAMHTSPGQTRACVAEA